MLDAKKIWTDIIGNKVASYARSVLNRHGHFMWAEYEDNGDIIVTQISTVAMKKIIPYLAHIHVGMVDVPNSNNFALIAYDPDTKDTKALYMKRAGFHYAV